MANLFKTPRKVQWLVLVLVLAGTAFLIYNRVSDKYNDNFGLNSKASGNEDFTGITAELLNMVQQYKKATPEEKPALTGILIDLAMERRSAMLEALDNNPKAVVRATIPAGLAKQLPAEITKFIETEATVSGTVKEINTYYNDKSEKNEYTLTDSRGNKYQIRSTATGLGKVHGGSKVKISGTALNDNIIPEDDRSIVVTSPNVLGATTQRKAAVILVNFQNDTTTNTTQDTARGAVFTDPDSANAYYKTVSYGQLEITGNLRPDGDVFGYYTIPYTNENCLSMYGQWETAAKNMAAKDGFIDSNYNNKIFVWNASCGNVAGMGNSGSGDAWFQTSALTHKFTMFHELGHTLGWTHSGTIECRDSAGIRVTISSSCTVNQYGDVYEIMGGGGTYAHPNNHKKGFADQYHNTNWIPASNVLTLPLGQSGTYTIVPIQQSVAGIQTLRIPKNFAPEGGTPYQGYFYLEFRDNTVFGPYAPGYPAGATDGIMLRWGPEFNDSNLTWLFDASPESNSWADVALKAGKTFTDPQSGITITTNSVSPSGAVVTISSTTVPCTRTNPLLSGGASFSTTAGYTNTISYTLTNRDSSSCPPSTFTVAPSNFPTGWYMTPSSVSETLAPGATIVRTINITSASTTTAGDYVITISARDNADANRVSNLPMPFTIRNDSGGGGTPTPNNITVSVTAPVSGTTLKAKSSTTITANATDPTSTISSVSFYVNGFLKCSDTNAPYSCVWSVPAGKKSYQLSAVAANSAGATKTSSSVIVNAR